MTTANIAQKCVKKNVFYAAVDDPLDREIKGCI